MSRKKEIKILLIITLLSLFLCFIPLSFIQDFQYRTINSQLLAQTSTRVENTEIISESISSPTIKDYISHGPFTIDSDDDFISYSFPGSGMSNDPYIIENYEIITSSDQCILIQGTTKHVIIKNCYFRATGDYTEGITVEDVAPGTVKIANNIFDRLSQECIEIIRANHTIITQNEFLDSRYGIDAHYTHGIVIQSNNFDTFEIYGLRIDETNNPYVVGNNFSNSDETGFKLQDSQHCTIANNTFTSNDFWGLYFDSSSDVILTANNFVNDGMYLEHYDIELYTSYQVSDNRIGGKLLGWFINEKDLIIDDPVFGQIFLINCVNCIVKNQIIPVTDIGIQSTQGYNLTITNNTFQGGYFGIDLFDSKFILVENNTIYNERSGVLVWGTTYSNIENNLFYDNSCGCNLGRSDTNLVNNNTYFENACGMKIFESEHVIVSNSLFESNYEYGLKNDRANNNTITFNSFIDNNYQWGRQAYDIDVENLFIHNFWHDHTTPDDNGDGIVDTPYVSGGDFEDSEPLAINPILVNLPPKITHVVKDKESPTEFDAISIFALVVDNDYLTEVKLFYRIDNGTWKSKDMNLFGSCYVAEIGGFDEKTVVDYYVFAKDNDNNEVSSMIYSFEIMETEKTSSNTMLFSLGIVFALGFANILIKNIKRKIPKLKVKR